MRKDWEYKKLGEVCINITDGSHTPPKGIDYSEFKMISSQNVFDDMLQITDENVRFLTEEQFIKENKRTNLCKDIVLLTIVGTIGRCCVLSGNEGSLTLQRSVAALKPNPELLSRFLMYLLIGNRKKLENEARGIAQKGVYLKQLSSLSVPIPPKSTQLAIVAELDKLNEMIRLKKQQLEDYDQLAQSIFYEMFGDPVENEKGWEVKKLGEVCETSSGGTPSKTHTEYYENGTIPWLRSGEVSQGYIYDAEIYISELGLNKSSAKIFPKDTVLIAMYGATVGEVGILCNPMCTNQAICGILPNDLYNSEFLRYVLLSHKDKYLSLASGGAQPNISQQIIKSTLIPFIDKPLQQQFAARIEAIERQKQQVSETIKDLETLLASRMQYWFD